MTCNILLLLIAAALMLGQSHGQDFGNRDTDFRISIVERTEFPPGLEARIETTTRYSCEGYTIRSQVSWQRDSISITIDGFLRPSPCFSTMSRATGTVYLGSIGDGTYILGIRYRGDEDFYRLILKDGRPAIDTLHATFTGITWE